MDLAQLLIESLLDKDSIKTVSKNSGTSSNQTREVVVGALPLLLRSMQENASGKDGEEALAKALEFHSKSNTSDLTAFLKNADIEDGNKILTHILGNNKKNVEADLAKKAGVTTAQSSNILANIVPLLLTLIGIQAMQKTVAGGLGPLLASVLLGGGGLGGGKSGGGGSLEEMLLGGLSSVLTGQQPAKGKKKSVAKKTAKSSGSTRSAKSTKKYTKKKEPDNLVDGLIGSLFGINGKEK